MRTLILLTVSIIFFPFVVDARIWRVNNQAGVDADFATVAEAIEAASANDTIFIEPSVTSYGSITLDKPLYLIGVGYLLGANNINTANEGNAKVGDISVGTEAGGSVVESLIINAVQITASNVTIKRNYVSSSINPANTSVNPTNVLVVNNFLAAGGSSIYGGFQNIIVANNYIAGSPNLPGPASIINNVIKGNTYVGSGRYENNIFITDQDILARHANADVAFVNNIAAGNVGSANGNLSEVDLAEVFVVAPSIADNALPEGFSSDSRWQLKENSPAQGAGTSGIDIGMFGGTSSYVLSGLPDIPILFDLELPVSTTTEVGLPVKVKIRTN